MPSSTSSHSDMQEGATEESGGFLGGISVSKTDNRPGVVAPAPASSVRTRPSDASSSARRQYKETDLLQVASWWKWGGNGEALIADGTACKEAIGETAEASFNFSTLSVSVLKCLEKKGWRYLLAEQE